MDADVGSPGLQRALAFAANTAATVREVAPDPDVTFTAETYEKRNEVRVLVSHTPDVITLRAGGVGNPILDLVISMHLTADRSDQYLKVVRSTFRVLPHGSHQPLFRYEFDSGVALGRKLPTAHVQFHGRHDELERVLLDAGRSTTKSQNHREAPRPNVTDLHFPLGGTRFRPCFEDVLHMLVVEFDVVELGRKSDVLRVLSDAREGWRATQLRAAVRDNPQEAASVLHDMGVHCCDEALVSTPVGGRLLDY